MFKRRSKKEVAPLVILKATDLILRLENQITPPDQRNEIFHLSQEGLSCLIQLLRNNQVVLLLDYAKTGATDWALQNILLD